MSAGRFGGRRRLLPGLALGLALAFPALGAEPLRIGTREAPPFAMRAAGGE